MKKLSFAKKVITLGSSLILSSGLFLAGCSSKPIIGTNFHTSFEDKDPATNITIINSVNCDVIQDNIAFGPTNDDGWNHQNGYGFTGTHSFAYHLKTQNAFSNTACNVQLFSNLNVLIGENFKLSYKIFPSYGNKSNPNLAYPGSYASIDLLYNDSPNDFTHLQNLSNIHGITDQYGFSLDAYSQGNEKSLMCGEWNSKRVDLKKIIGKHVHSIVFRFDSHVALNANVDCSGYVDDIDVSAQNSNYGNELYKYVDTRRGTSSSSDYSRGNNFPITAVPNGFNFYTPFTADNSNGGGAIPIYSWFKNNDSTGLTRLEGVGISHEPSIWMGDYDEFWITPESSSSSPLYFSHDNEIARPDYYCVTTLDGIKIEMTPASHSAIFRFTFPNDWYYGSIALNSCDAVSDFATHGSWEENNSFNYWTQKYIGNSQYASSSGSGREFIRGEFSQPFSYHNDNNVAQFDLQQYSHTVTLRLASSFISTNQAIKNLTLETSPLTDSNCFDNCWNIAKQEWNERLGAINISHSDATDEQKILLYSNLYRLNCYPNLRSENEGSNESPSWKYASPTLSVSGSATSSATNQQIRDGKMYVNIGFWDGLVGWPLYSILYPSFTKELIDGFLLMYKDSGWVPRWSSPGYADCMDGTSSDVNFAQAYISGAVSDPNTALYIYASGIRDALTTPDCPELYGRKGNELCNYLGYVPYDSTAPIHESTCWSFQTYACDYAIGQLALKLSTDSQVTDDMTQTVVKQTKTQIHDTGEYLINRSRNYSKIFDSTVGFFRAKDSAGAFNDEHSSGSQDFDPRNWGWENTESNAWNYLFSGITFDNDGMINLLGGQEHALSKLDNFFNTQETAEHKGGYGGIIHEMREARDCRMGELAMSNQPSYPIPYMYAAFGKPAKTQSIVRDILQRLYMGSDIGQGYMGDEDNGSSSAWYILSSLGIYDTAPGCGQYIITSPLYTDVTINRDNNKSIHITSNASWENKYINELKINGTEHNNAYVDQTILLNNNSTLNFKLTNSPTTWGDKTIPISGPQHSLSDITSSGTLFVNGSENGVGNLSDMNMTTSFSITSLNTLIVWHNPSPNNQPSIKEIGIACGNTYIPELSITISGSDDNADWTSIISGYSLKYDCKQQNRIIAFTPSKDYEYYKIQITSNIAAYELSEIAMYKYV